MRAYSRGRPLGASRNALDRALLTEDAAFRILIRVVAAIAVIVAIVLIVRALT